MGESIEMPVWSVNADVMAVHKHVSNFCFVFYRVGENGAWDQMPPINTGSNATTYQVTGLVPFTVYSFRLRAVNKLGISPPSKESYYIVSLREGMN